MVFIQHVPFLVGNVVDLDHQGVLVQILDGIVQKLGAETHDVIFNFDWDQEELIQLISHVRRKGLR